MALALIATPAVAQPIDRHALVSRHNITLAKIDPHAPLMLGNGNLGFTADITGLQTFPEQYSPIAPLLTMAQWAWHSFPNPNGYKEADGMVMVPVPGRGEQPYPWIRDWAELDKRPALKWLRENPHRFSLGRIALALTHGDGRAAVFGDLTGTSQKLDLWTGTLTSKFVFDGSPVTVETHVDNDRDAVIVSIASPLVASGRLGVDVRFPGVSPKINPDPSDWTRPESHRTTALDTAPRRLLLERTLDDTVYYSQIATAAGSITANGPHAWRILARDRDRLVLAVQFDRVRPGRDTTRLDPAPSMRAWRSFWQSGGAIDFTGSSDPRAAELERRVVLSQYLARINEAGEYPPQEEGLFSNSWNGKFHLEIHPLHSAHWAAWGKPALLEKSLSWYLGQLPHAREVAKTHGVDGAWWTKMSGPNGWNSPSTINPFIMWQQPNPIYMAELAYRADPKALQRYGELVEQTGRLLGSWPQKQGDRYVLGPPIVPVQENHPPLTTVNPAYETEFYRWGLTTAQAWRVRRGLKRNAEWDKVIAGLAPPAQKDGLYLPVESEPDFWRTSMSAECSGHAEPPLCLNRDHPSFLMAWGLIPGARIDPETMRRTLRATEQHWDLRQTWGWDYPVIAMTAARLGERGNAVDWLLRDLPNNQWGVSGMTPRVHLEAEKQLIGPAGTAAGAGPDGPGYSRAAETYFPSNGSLLLAVGMMAAGWDGAAGHAPGFPEKGWKVRVEGIKPIP